MLAIEQPADHRSLNIAKPSFSEMKNRLSEIESASVSRAVVCLLRLVPPLAYRHQHFLRIVLTTLICYALTDFNVYTSSQLSLLVSYEIPTCRTLPINTNIIAMSNLKNSPFGKRLRATHHHETEDDSYKRDRPRTLPLFGLSNVSMPTFDSRPSASDSARTNPNSLPGIKDYGKEYGDRFIPSRETGDMRTSYHLMNEKQPNTPSKSRIIPTESDALKEQANTLFASVLHTEVTPPSPCRSVSPVRQSSASVPPTTPTRRRLFAYNSPSNPATPSRRLDTPTDEAYSMSPVRSESRLLLESPRRRLRNVSKTPYRVLDAPELADDFYLSLVDWSSSNILAVGLGSSVYLWTAHTADVSRLPDPPGSTDPISSISWVQKVCP